MQLYTILFLIFLKSVTSFSSIGDSTKTLRKINFYFALDIRKSLVRDIPIKMTGLKIGATFKKKHTVGFGYYNLGRPIFGYYLNDPVEYDANQSLRTKSGSSIDIPTTVSLSFQYFSLFYEYRILARKKWNLDWTAQYGIGRAYITATNQKNGLRIPGYPKSSRVHLLESSILLQYKVFTWLGVGAGVGYRYILNPNEYISATFNYPIWVIKLMVSPGKLLKVFKGKEKWYK
ncbi:MAG: hypothetical protein H7329_17405 [Opitutaceae bacterium]|nr:hypothetical protein [Cytophagales bacterium]